MEFIRFALVIVAVLSPVVLIFVSPEIFPHLAILWVAVLGIVATIVMLFRYFR